MELFCNEDKTSTGPSAAGEEDVEQEKTISSVAAEVKEDTNPPVANAPTTTLPTTSL